MLNRLLSGRWLVAMIGLCGFSLLSGCSHTPQTQRLLQDAGSSLSQRVELSDVPFFPQTEFQCGPAALATVFQYRGKAVLPDDLVSQVYVPEKQGSLQIEMTAAVRRQGLVPYPLAGSMEALLREVAAGNPVLVMQNLAFSWYPQWHYAVVVGYDLAQQTLVLRSGETRRWQTTLRTFENTWARSNYWGLVIVPPTQLPQTADSFTWLRQAYDLEQVGQVEAAEQAYLTAHQAWLNQTKAGLALGNLYYRQARYEASAHVFAELVERAPTQAALWNNWAYALQAMPCPLSAWSAAKCARQLAPKDDNIEQTKQEIHQTLSDPSTSRCRWKIVCPQ